MKRDVTVSRKTAETDIQLTFNPDGQAVIEIKTGIGFFDHMLEQLASHGGFRLELECQGDLHIDTHHTVEDVAIAVGVTDRQAQRSRELPLVDFHELAAALQGHADAVRRELDEIEVLVTVEAGQLRVDRQRFRDLVATAVDHDPGDVRLSVRAPLAECEVVLARTALVGVTRPGCWRCR